MRQIRAAAAKKENMLNLGPLHKNFHTHILRVINNPALILNSCNYKTATADGEPWESQKVVECIQSLIPTFPSFEPMFVAGLQGAAATWSRFTSKFAPGGLIDEATQEERDLAWMAPTNDVNEGALGAFRLMMHKQPQLSLLGYNSQAMYFHNDTAAFIKLLFINLKGQSLKDMVQVYKDAGAHNLEQIKSSTKVGEIRTALCVAISLYDSGQWKPFADSGDEDSDEEGDSSKPVDNVASEGDVIDDSADWEDDIN
ncbi:hypothetical protein FA15DRAFT_710670 [Coprinopsis marcescibilis]|uniref:Uncharacterized protein n=1 Tax=Coprinopsis marcescibilis TaxID=230819 RepID=A0A5C3KD37_COPMA|nr:hypothetical protein FA15DRAFT_710670 [Coprinopsis marcescibilis]